MNLPMAHWQKHWSQQGRLPRTERATSPQAPKKEVGSPGDDDRLLTSDEAAEYVRLSRRTLERYRVTGGGPNYVKLGPGLRARVVYREADLKAWLDGAVFNSTSEYDHR